MNSQKICDGVWWVGAIDWDRRLFDSLVPTPNGTSYNAYLVRGAEKTVLLDAVDCAYLPTLLEHLRNVPRIDAIVAHHVEQDHSGCIPYVLQRYPDAHVLATPRAKDMLIDHLRLDPAKIDIVADGETFDLGGLTLRFLHAPWQHWPETMMTYMPERGVLFSCDLFGAHLATTEMFVDIDRLRGAMRGYYAEIMMPFHAAISRNIDKLDGLDLRLIAPSHGPMHPNAAAVVAQYRDWISGKPQNKVLLPYVTMHGSTREMVERMLRGLNDRGVHTFACDLTGANAGALTDELVESASMVVATPTVLGGAHPLVVSAAYLVNALKPRLLNVGLLGSYGWGGKVAEQLRQLLSGLRVEFLDPVLTRGFPRPEDCQAVDAMAAAIAERHRAAGL